MPESKQKSPQVVLYYPRYWGPKRPVVRVPLSLLAAASVLDKEGYAISALSAAFLENPEEKVVEDCRNAICLGISSMTGYQIIDGLKVARMVREKYPNLPIVWGGWHPTLETDVTLKNPYVDIIVRGQGERTFPELVHALEAGRPLKDVVGISYKVNGELVHNPGVPLEDINKFPPVPYHLIDVEKALANDEFGSRVLNYISSYGCPFQCGFCAEWRVHNRRWVALTGERMAADFEGFARDYKVDCVAVNDTQFFLRKDRVKTFCEELLRRKLDIKWDNVQGNIRQLLAYDDNMWDLMYRSGLRSILVGAESGFPDALKLINKELTVEETIRFAEKCKKFNIKVLYSMIIGLPWDKDYTKTRKLIDEEIRLTLDLAAKLIKIDDRNRILLCIYTPYAGNPLFERALEIGLKPPDSLEGWGNWVLGQRTAPWIAPKQAAKVNMISSYLFFFLDSTSYKWVTDRVKNPVLNLLFRVAFKAYTGVARFRWKHRFFAIPLDYWVYRWARDILGIA